MYLLEFLAYLLAVFRQKNKNFKGSKVKSVRLMMPRACSLLWFIDCRKKVIKNVLFMFGYYF